MYRQIKDFYADRSWKGKELNQIELVAWTQDTPIHGREREDVKAHHELPAYVRGVLEEDRLVYFKTLDAYAVERDL